MGTSLLLVILIPASLVAGYFIRRFQAQKQTENAEALAKKIMQDLKISRQKDSRQVWERNKKLNYV